MLETLAAGWETLFALTVIAAGAVSLFGFITILLAEFKDKLAIGTGAVTLLFGIVRSIFYLCTLIGVIGALIEKLPMMHNYAQNWTFYLLVTLLCAFVYTLLGVSNFLSAALKKWGRLIIGSLLSPIVRGLTIIFGTLFVISAIAALAHL